MSDNLKGKTVKVWVKGHEEFIADANQTLHSALAIGNKDKIVVCSTATGPAFEGGELSCGMRAGEGAIDDVTITDDVHITTINKEKPKGICGSGVIKAIAQPMKAGAIEASGRFAKGSEIDELRRNLLQTWPSEGSTEGSGLMIGKKIFQNFKPLTFQKDC